MQLKIHSVKFIVPITDEFNNLAKRPPPPGTMHLIKIEIIDC